MLRSEFLFQIGSIRRVTSISCLNGMIGFYSRLVRLEGNMVITKKGSVLVSIPDWFD